MLRGSRVIVPRSMRKEMKSRIHEGHLGVERCKARAQEVYIGWECLPKLLIWFPVVVPALREERNNSESQCNL